MGLNTSYGQNKPNQAAVWGPTVVKNNLGTPMQLQFTDLLSATAN